MGVYFMLMHHLSVIVRYHWIFCERQLARLGIDLGYPEQSVLLFISVFENANQETIARHLLIDKGAITRTIVKLEEKRLISRQENPHNKREKLLTLTQAGQAMLGPIRQVLATWDEAVLAGLSPTELAALEPMVQNMTKNAIATHI